MLPLHMVTAKAPWALESIRWLAEADPAVLCMVDVRWQRTPLHWFLDSGTTVGGDVLDSILMSCKDALHRKDRDRRTPLMIAASRPTVHSVDVVYRLVRLSLV